MSSNEERPIIELLWKELNDLKRQNKMLKLEKAKRLHKDGYRCWINMEDAKAVDKLSEACNLYEEVYEKSSKKLGKFYILYAKSLKYFASRSTKIIGDCSDYFDKNDEENDGNELDEWNEDSDDDDSESKENVESNTEAKIIDKEPGTTADSKTIEDMSKSTQEDSQESSSSDNRKETVNIKEDSSIGSIKDGEKLASNNEESFENAEHIKDNIYATKLKVGREKLRLAKEIFEGLGKGGLKNLDEVKRLLAKFETPNDIEKRREIIRREYSKLYITIIGKDGKGEPIFVG
ncbi:protein NASP homolog [Glossina fuscipes]|uniref:Protein NASP homolog n=1 Tax=Glossina fuscipes TaxID=7396 RepID=A0A9C6DVZ0_9MUSC|nr:protein NASP homolog [Glossina fuscipes]